MTATAASAAATRSSAIAPAQSCPVRRPAQRAPARAQDGRAQSARSPDSRCDEQPGPVVVELVDRTHEAAARLRRVTHHCARPPLRTPPSDQPAGLQPARRHRQLVDDDLGRSRGAAHPSRADRRAASPIGPRARAPPGRSVDREPLAAPSRTARTSRPAGSVASRRARRPSRSSRIARTVAASAWPRVAFMTAPTSAPTAATLPPRTFSAMSGLAAIASSAARSSAPESDTTAQAAVGDHLVDVGARSRARRRPTWRASAAESVPSATSAMSRATCVGVDRQLGRLDLARVRLLGQVAQPPVAGLGRPARRPRRSPRPDRRRRRSTSPAGRRPTRPATSLRRARRAIGSSGRSMRSFSTQSASGAIGTRSGSGKYR